MESPEWNPLCYHWSFAEKITIVPVPLELVAQTVIPYLTHPLTVTIAEHGHVPR